MTMTRLPATLDEVAALRREVANTIDRVNELMAAESDLDAALAEVTDAVSDLEAQLTDLIQRAKATACGEFDGCAMT